MNYITLFDLQSKIQDALTYSLDATYWVVAEVSEMKLNSTGHCYMELVEKSENSGQARAKSRAMIWASRFTALNNYFMQTTSSPIKNGIKVLVNVRVSFHALYGMSLVIENIDPNYTLGDIERQKQQTIAQLQKDGVFDMNRECDMDLAVKRIAVVSSSHAAGYTDFMQEITNNVYAYKYDIVLFETLVQGEGAETGVVESLQRVYDYHEGVKPFDCVALIRGGGSVNDLSCFDSYAIASAVAQLPIPVFTGIGHEKDVSVADLVAYKHLKTPTAVAQYIVSLSNIVDNSLEDAKLKVLNSIKMEFMQQSALITKYSNSLGVLATKSITDTRSRLDGFQNKLMLLLKLKYANEQNNLDNMSKSLASSLSSVYSVAHRDLELRKSKIEQFSPQRILELGYSLVSSKNSILKSINDFDDNMELTITTKDGSIKGEFNKNIAVR